VIADNLAAVKRRMDEAAARAGRNPASVTLVAVSKTRPAEAVKEAAAAGHLDFGENYAQEMRDKMRAVNDPKVRWHFIGRLQKNKVKYVVGKAAEMHALDSVDLAREMSTRAEREGALIPVYIEVNLGGEDTKAGVAPEAAEELLRAAADLPGLEPIGLMTMPPYFEDPEGSRPYYRGLRELRDELSDRLGIELPGLSMGLSHDFEVAIEEGATRIRVGAAIFGKRNYG